MNYTDATPDEIKKVMEDAGHVFLAYRATAPEIKARLLEKIAENIIALGDELLLKASEETNLPRLRKSVVPFEYFSVISTCQKSSTTPGSGRFVS